MIPKKRIDTRRDCITGLDLIRSTAVVRDGRITEYHVTVKLAFIVEPAAVGATEGREETAPPATNSYDELGIWGSGSDLV